jgi:hypothetical protein
MTTHEWVSEPGRVAALRSGGAWITLLPRTGVMSSLTRDRSGTLDSGTSTHPDIHTANRATRAVTKSKQPHELVADSTTDGRNALPGVLVVMARAGGARRMAGAATRVAIGEMSSGTQEVP